jgi:hypothetical protein
MELEMSLPETGSSAIAQRHEPSPPKRLRLSEGITNDDDTVPEWDCSAPYEQWLDYSAYESLHKSPSLQSFHKENSPESNALTSQDEDGEAEEAVELRAADPMPAFFHPSMFN